MPLQSRRSAVATLLCLALASAATAQTPAPASAASLVKLDQEKEALYRAKLREFQEPVLKAYLAELKTLLATTLIASEAEPIRAEIARVEKQIAQGTLDLRPPEIIPVVKPGNRQGILFKLEPHESTTTPVTNAKGDPVLHLGSTTWRLSKLPAGSYKLTVSYACARVPPGAALTFAFAGTTYRRELRPELSTKDETTYRPLRVPLVIDKDATMETLSLTSEGSPEPWLYLREIVITRDAPAKP